MAVFAFNLSPFPPNFLQLHVKVMLTRKGVKSPEHFHISHLNQQTIACSKPTLKPLEGRAKYVQSQKWRQQNGFTGVFIVNLEHISYDLYGV